MMAPPQRDVERSESKILFENQQQQVNDWFENPKQKEQAHKMSATPNQQQNAMMKTAMAFGLNATADKQAPVTLNTDAEDFAKDIQNRV